MANDIEMYYGDDITIYLTIYEGNSNNVVNLTDASVMMYVRYKITDNINNSFIKKEGTVVDAENGIVQFLLDYSDISGLSLVKTDMPYPTDFKLITSDNKIYTILRTNFRLR